MKYKVLKEHDSHFEIHDGKSSFKVAKKGLSQDLIAKIQQYPQHLDEGGEVLEDASAPPLDQSFERLPASDPVMFGFGSSGQTPGMMDSLANSFDLSKAQAPELSQASTAKATEPEFNVAPDGTIDPRQFQSKPEMARTPSATNQAGAALPQTSDPITSAVKGYQGALTGLAKVQGEVADKQAKIQQDYIDDMQLREAAHREELGNLARENDTLFQAVQNEKIDPKRLWNNASTGNKIAASIGLILGGMGAGMTHGPNQALQVMQNAIDRDVDAQKTELGKKQNLLTYNLQKYRDVQMAENATRLQLSTTANAMMQKAALESGNPLAQAQAKIAGQQITLQYAPMLQQLALSRVHAQALGAGGGQGGIQEGQEPAGLLMDEKYRKQRVPVNGRVYQHTGTDQDASEMRTFESKLGPIQDSVRRLDQLGPSALIPGSTAYNQAQAIRANLATSIAGMKSTEIGSKKINEAEANKALEQVQDPTKFTQMLNGGVRNQEFFKDLAETAESLRQQNLIGYKGMKSVPFNAGPKGQTLPLNKAR